jgi:hypothetical protein
VSMEKGRGEIDRTGVRVGGQDTLTTGRLGGWKVEPPWEDPVSRECPKVCKRGSDGGRCHSEVSLRAQEEERRRPDFLTFENDESQEKEKEKEKAKR